MAAEMPGTDNREVARSFLIIDEVLADHRELS
ncbi:aminoglycoside phosphotransferase [Renibacterium salmoninarum ATCC 33209]|uniref:Aminoglycoside phosphotransferase n=1 Tax=Renibacterium salmoninarum (strain ATCC 33209 / DSM 20767 / JCM 11484 / NBRC 15589 / NCIMB 2235) TaxID=288705 RepID=A9WP01_RENSM|nr:aminoglycoside phosphotransferase [Renibacterium salmoninarum ATCC 33209]